jgi:hypothetical protein
LFPCNSGTLGVGSYFESSGSESFLQSIREDLHSPPETFVDQTALEVAPQILALKSEVQEVQKCEVQAVQGAASVVSKSKCPLHLDKLLGPLVVSRGSPDGFPSAGSVVDSDVETESMPVRNPVRAEVNPRTQFISTGF